MRLEVKRITEALRGPEAYAIYRACLYRPTPEKYAARVDALLENRVYGCYADGALAGILALAPDGTGAAEILGIAVAEDRRGQGIGRLLLARAAAAEGLRTLRAETDAEAVGFYRRCGFRTERFFRDFGGQAVERFRCTAAL